DLGRPPRRDVLEHRRVVAAAALRCEDVHLPGVLMELDPGGRGDPLALLDQAVDEVAEVAGVLALGEVAVVRKAGERGDGVDGRGEDQLRPLGRAQVGERPRRQGRAAGSVAARTRVTKSWRPETLRPSAFRAWACSSRRVSTDTSATRPRCPAKRLPITPAPTTQTRSTASSSAPRSRVRRAFAGP